MWNRWFYRKPTGRAKGRLSNLIEKTDAGNALKGTYGIGHTRWATHGEPSQTNAHPHVSGNCSRSGSGAVEAEVVGVHNGIIENYTELKEKLLKHGYTFYSQTDTEVVIKLVDYYYKKYNLGPIDAIAKTMVRVRGSYALELMFRDYPGEIWGARKDSPMIIGIADGEIYVASDVPAILKYTRNVYYQKKKLLADCYAFLKPDAEMLDKYIRSLDEARNADVIDEKTFLFLRTHKVVLDSLMDITKGDYARFNSNTYLEVYEDIQEKAQKKYKDEVAAHTQTQEKLKKLEKDSSDEIETLKARISVMEDKEKNDFEKKVSILGWIMTLALAGFPYLLLGVGIEMIKMLFSTVSLLSAYVIAGAIIATTIDGVLFEKGKKWCFEKARSILEKRLKNSSGKSSDDL